MELWIRSQDKKRLIKSEKLITVEFTERTECEIWDNDVKLGTYKTKERALEVLDEITSILKFKQSIALDNTVNIRETLEQNFTNEQIDYVMKQLHVYEMPKE